MKEGKEEEDLSILVVGLGNTQYNAGCPGSLCGRSSERDETYYKGIWKICNGEWNMRNWSVPLSRGDGQTGMETTEIVRGIVRETRPDLVIAVDALAARNSRRLNRTIQIADTGIHPGSGVGNYRNGMTKESLGVPVIGIGVPTVVDAATIVNDTMENFIHALEESETLKSVGETLRSYNAGGKV